MADLFRTNLVLVASPLPADFVGTPQEFFSAFVERLEIQSPVGTNFFVTGDVEPSQNSGPWLRGGVSWFVWSDAQGRYIPLDISPSIQALFTVSPTEPLAPEEGEAQIWLQTASGRVIGWKFWTGSAWRADGNVTASGTTAQRPSEPAPFEKFFDTDINALLHFERGAWRTVSGVPQDVKQVVTATLADALRQNPGWAFLGGLDASFMGAVLGVASKDPGATPAANFAVDSGITARASGDYVGAETHVLSAEEIQQHTHLVGTLQTFTPGENRMYFYRVDDGETFIAPPPQPPNNAHVRGITPGIATDGPQPGPVPTISTGTITVTSKQLDITAGANYTEAAVAHNTMQPTWFLWTLYKL